MLTIGRETRSQVVSRRQVERLGLAFAVHPEDRQLRVVRGVKGFEYLGTAQLQGPLPHINETVPLGTIGITNLASPEP
jgi:hypothetical protein